MGKRKDVMGISLIIFGIYSIIVNFVAETQCEYVLQQIYFALQEIVGWLAILIGVLVYKID